MIATILNIISISTIFIMLGSIYARFIKNTVMIKTLIGGVFSLGMSLLIFIFFNEHVIFAKYTTCINLSIVLILLIYMLAKASFLKQGHKILLFNVSRSGAILTLLFIAIAIAQIVSSIFLFIDTAYILSNFISYIFISILISSVILLPIYRFKLRTKFQKVIDIENKISGAFIVSVFFWSIYTILGINNSFRYFYSPIYNEIFIKDGFSFLTKNSDFRHIK